MTADGRKGNLWLLVGPLFLLALVSMSVGKYAGPAEIAGALRAALSGQPSDPVLSTVLWNVRLPRVAGAILIGAALAAAGATYQGLFRNPLVSPDILGVSGGASLGAVIGIFLSLPVLAIQAISFAGGLLAVAAVYAVGMAIRGRDPALTLVLAGIAIGALVGAGISLIKILADPYDQLPAITYWLLGSLA
ncbi:FecCD family ABC transporter permease, partial [Ensifer sp. 2YAB10]